jgi:diketogulonate reductase-like aldo/keto reductase
MGQTGLLLLPSSRHTVSVGLPSPCSNPYSPYRSFWTLTGSPSLLRHPTLVALSQSASCTPEQAVFRLAQMRGIVPLLGSTNEDRMKKGLDAFGINLEQTTGSEKAIRDLNELIGGH